MSSNGLWIVFEKIIKSTDIIMFRVSRMDLLCLKNFKLTNHLINEFSKVTSTNIFQNNKIGLSKIVFT